jgi:hypothetical protein
VAARRNRLWLSLVLVASCLWCIDQVRQVQARQAADAPPAAVSRSVPPPKHPEKQVPPLADRVVVKTNQKTIKYQ